MLVLSRVVGEQIFITGPDGRRITITMVEGRIGKARIGIDAPKDYVIHRAEVQSIIDAEKLAQV